VIIISALLLQQFLKWKITKTPSILNGAQGNQQRKKYILFGFDVFKNTNDFDLFLKSLYKGLHLWTL